MAIFRKILSFILKHKLIIFVVAPFVVAFLIIFYVFVIYINWQADKNEALDRLARYKRLIDRTEEMREGMIFSASDYGLEEKAVDLPTTIYDRNGEVIGQFFDQKREIVPYSSIPEALVNAVLASEDREFYNHKGVNFKGVARAMLINLRHFRLSQGGSTVTQQLGKVLFTNMERSVKRKIYDIFCAYEIERHYDKQDILSMYLNLIYFGNGAYGVESTSKMFFGKSVKECNETECAAIVATISSAKRYSPLSNLDNSVKKTRRILKSMVDAGYITQERADFQYKRYLNKWDVQFAEDGTAESSLIGNFVYSSYRINRAPFFNEKIRRILVARYGEEVLKKGGLSVRTTIDIDFQENALNALRKGIDRQRDYHLAIAKKHAGTKTETVQKERASNIEGALIALDPYTGKIVAYVGGYEFSTKHQLDHVSQVRRQPGSSIKPLLYCSAIEKKVITPSTVIVDEPTTFEGDYAPQNYGGKYHGPMIVREALRKSVNIVAVKVLSMVGYDTVFSYIRKALDLDKSELNKRFYKTLSFALGTYELSPLEDAVLHATVINGGDYIKPYGITKIQDYNGQILWDYETDVQDVIRSKRRQYGKIIDPIAAAVTVNMLQGVLEPGGTAYGTKVKYGIDFPAAGKTGTSTNYNDAWFVGYTSQVVTAVWIGNEKGAISLGKGRSGGSVSAPVWGEFISNSFKKDKPGSFNVPDEGISYQTIDLETGLVPKPGVEDDTIAIDQMFYEGSEPGEYAE